MLFRVRPYVGPGCLEVGGGGGEGQGRVKMPLGGFEEVERGAKEPRERVCQAAPSLPGLPTRWIEPLQEAGAGWGTRACERAGSGMHTPRGRKLEVRRAQHFGVGDRGSLVSAISIFDIEVHSTSES